MHSWSRPQSPVEHCALIDNAPIQLVHVDQISEYPNDCQAGTSSTSYRAITWGEIPCQVGLFGFRSTTEHIDTKHDHAAHAPRRSGDLDNTPRTTAMPPIVRRSASLTNRRLKCTDCFALMNCLFSMACGLDFRTQLRQAPNRAPI